MIEVKDLHKSFGHLEVLKGITETIQDQEIVSIIGPSGCAVSTFWRNRPLERSSSMGTTSPIRSTM